MFRKSFIVLLTAVSSFGCAHRSNPERAPAEAAALRASHRAEINPKGEAGAYTIDAKAVFPLGRGVSFADIVEIFRGVEVSNEVNRILVGYKDPPLDKILSEVSIDAKPNKLTYYIFGYPKGFRIAGSWSRMICPETYVREAGKGYWRQNCAADFAYKGTGDYMAAYHQEIECREIGRTVECGYRISGAMKPIKVPFIARLLFNARDYSATQAAYKAVENLLHSFYSQAKIGDFPKPFRAAAQRAVEAYRASADYRNVTKIDAVYPKEFSSKRGASFASE